MIVRSADRWSEGGRGRRRGNEKERGGEGKGRRVEEVGLQDDGGNSKDDARRGEREGGGKDMVSCRRREEEVEVEEWERTGDGTQADEDEKEEEEAEEELADWMTIKAKEVDFESYSVSDHLTYFIQFTRE